MGVILVLPCPGVWLSRCCAYQGSFRKSSKSVVNSVAHIRESACFQGFSEIIKVVGRIVVLPAPLYVFLKWQGIAIWVIISLVGMYYALKVEKYKKKHDIQTYKEIVAFMEGQSLSQIEKAREEGKRPYQKGLLMVASFLITFILVSIIMVILL